MKPPLDMHSIRDLLSSAVQQHQAGNLPGAEAAYIRILEQQPDHDNALHLLGVIHSQTGRYKSAAKLIMKAIDINPMASTYHVNMANTFFANCDLDRAAEFFKKGIELDPENKDAINGLAMVFNERGNYEAAIEYLHKALGLDPEYPEAYNNLGIACWKQGDLDGSRRNIEKAIQLNPSYAEAYNNLGNVLWDQKKYETSIDRCREALRLNPDFAEGYKNMAEKLWSLGEIETAIGCYREGIKLDPVDVWRIRSAMMLPPIYHSADEASRCRQRLIEKIDDLSGEELDVSLRFEDLGTNFYLAYQGKNDKKIQRKFARLLRSARIPACEINATNTRNERMKIGFISTFFQDYHTIGKLNRGIISKISREKFHVSLFSLGYQPKAATKNMRAAADSFFELPKKLSVIQETVLQQDLDLLFFTDIGMDPATFITAFSRLAPVQCVTWGHPVTTGIDTIDYFISSKDLEIGGSEGHYTEKLIKLNSSPTYYYRPQWPSPMKGRSSFGLSEEKHIYLCPQSLFKFHPEFDHCLAEILRRDSRGQLVLLSGVYARWNNLLIERFRCSIPDVLERISILPRQDYHDFLNLIAVSDVMLDTFFFGGGNTTYEGLFTGTPIVTLPSGFMRGRITYAIYRKMGMMDFVASNPEEYVDICLRLGRDKAYRQEMRSKLLAHNHLIYEDIEVVRELEEFLQWAIENAQNRTGMLKENIVGSHLEEIAMVDAGAMREGAARYDVLVT